jgi:hypothetical protein
MISKTSLQPSRGRYLSPLILGLTMGLLVSPTAWAQMIGSGPIGSGRAMGPKSQSTPEKPALPAPEAIPGSKPLVPAAPATRPAGDMQPTDALFDAINRGDIAAARDALNRGADLNGVNILGMTPMELSVDLGRNDISFLLLSMRGEDSDRGSRTVGRNATAPVTRTARTTSAPAPVRRSPEANARVASKPVATPKLFANDGGTPLPTAGFLGFDSRSAAN